MLVMLPSKSFQKLDLINTIQRLGVAYHFEHEIEESLSYMYTHYEEWIDKVDGDDLHGIALCFRLLRQQGYYVSCGSSLTSDDQGNFKKDLVDEVHGMSSLYEAIQIRIYGEEIMDEAWTFTITQLKLILPKLSNSQLSQQISHTLKFPIKDGMMKKVVRTYFEEAKWYHEKKVPTMEQYMKNGIASSGYLLLATTFWLGMGKQAAKDAFDWISTEPPILAASCIIARLLNDLLSHEAKAYRKEDFDYIMSKVGKVNPRVKEYLEEAGYEKWSRCHSPVNRGRTMTSNIAECINGCLVEARVLPIIGFLEDAAWNCNVRPCKASST
ncbi:putative early nodulin-93-like [Capsicum annuum]|nr:putative early nodulin-93-like [Capsicum annuum]